jgi:type IV secretory pathway VirB2 component (pilin)
MLAQSVLLEAPGAGLPNAAAWIAGAMTGSLATIVATLAIAALGLAMLLGRMSVRDGARTALGCFILFGAPGIAAALMQAAPRSTALASVAPAPAAPIPPVPQPPRPNADPYAGASLPMQ